MKQITVGVAAPRNADGTFGEAVPIVREVPDAEHSRAVDRETKILRLFGAALLDRYLRDREK